MITLIVARARDGAIGRQGLIPWDLPEDLQGFRRETLGGALIMGRATWQSLPTRPLPGRLNIVVSSRPGIAEVVVPSVGAAIERAAAAGHHRLYGIGGAGIYAALLPRAHRLLITEVDLQVADADTHFPPLTLAGWREIGRRCLRPAAPVCWVHEYLRCL